MLKSKFFSIVHSFIIFYLNPSIAFPSTTSIICTLCFRKSDPLLWQGQSSYLQETWRVRQTSTRNLITTLNLPWMPCEAMTWPPCDLSIDLLDHFVNHPWPHLTLTVTLTTLNHWFLTYLTTLIPTYSLLIFFFFLSSKCSPLLPTC